MSDNLASAWPAGQSSRIGDRARVAIYDPDRSRGQEPPGGPPDEPPSRRTDRHFGKAYCDVNRVPCQELSDAAKVVLSVLTYYALRTGYVEEPFEKLAKESGGRSVDGLRRIFRTLESLGYIWREDADRCRSNGYTYRRIWVLTGDAPAAPPVRRRRCTDASLPPLLPGLDLPAEPPSDAPRAGRQRPDEPGASARMSRAPAPALIREGGERVKEIVSSSSSLSVGPAEPTPPAPTYETRRDESSSSTGGGEPPPADAAADPEPPPTAEQIAAWKDIAKRRPRSVEGFDARIKLLRWALDDNGQVVRVPEPPPAPEPVVRTWTDLAPGSIGRTLKPPRVEPDERFPLAAVLEAIDQLDGPDGGPHQADRFARLLAGRHRDDENLATLGTFRDAALNLGAELIRVKVREAEGRKIGKPAHWLATAFANALDAHRKARRHG